MDSQERHDLKTNDLQDFFENFGDFWSKWGNTLLTVVAVVVIVFAGSKIYSDWTSQAREAAWSDLAGATSPQAADMVAADHSGNTMVRTLATLKAGDLYLFEASRPAPAENRAQPIDAGGDPVEKQRMEGLEQAESRYKTVLGMEAPPIVKINAQLGLASVAEGRQQWDQARSRYEQAITLAGDRFETLKTLAQQKQDMLPQLERPVVFGPSVEAAAEGQAPATSPASPDDTTSTQDTPSTEDTPSIGDMFRGGTVDTFESMAQPDTPGDETDDQP